MNGLKRKRIWEIAEGYACSVCGTCLSLEEQKTILKKVLMEYRNLPDYEIHAIMVQSLNCENKLSRRLDNRLNAKYRYEISQYGDSDEERFRQVWRERLPAGDICGLYWVAVTHNGLSEKTLEEIYCDVHMLSHLQSGKLQKERAEKARLLQAKSDLAAKLQQEKQRRKELAEALTQSEKTRRSLEIKVRNLEKSLPADIRDLTNANTAADTLVQENRELSFRLAQMENNLHNSFKHLQDLEKEKEAAASQLRVQKEINLQLCREIEYFRRDQHCDKAACAGDECCCNLCEKRVLIVGGITKLRTFYRNVVENLGGRFEYHDGYLQAGEKELECLIKKSDIILCPVDCNSHGAALSVKKICTRINKPYQMLASSSLSSISSALTTGGKTGPGASSEGSVS
jgi:hypothetical protein